MALSGALADEFLSEVAIRDLGERLHGELIRPGDDSYEGARRVWNLAVDRRPAIIVRASDAADVLRTVRFAAEQGLLLAVRSGGHSLAGDGTADRAVVLDLGSMRRLVIDSARRLAWAQPGLRAGEYTSRAHVHGLATPFGDTASVGLGGLTLGGGIGYLVRKHGLTIDNVVSMELVTADGRLLKVSATESPDLFWALRGGGGNFGVVTGLRYQLHDVGTVFGGALVLPATPKALKAFVPLAAAAPDELTIIAIVMRAPPAPFVPPDKVGSLVLALLMCAVGDLEGGEQAARPFRSLAAPVADTLGPMPYPAIYAYTAEAETPHPTAVRTMFTEDIDDATVEAILEHMARATAPMAMTQIRVLGGAMAAVASDATAFAHRHSPIMFTVMTSWEDGAGPEPHRAWTDGYWGDVRWKGTGAYGNFLGDEGDAGVRTAYPFGTHARLASLKGQYDPANLFRLNQNIRPPV
jgi:FAD/FMN-containing dehydrogenase